MYLIRAEAELENNSGSAGIYCRYQRFEWFKKFQNFNYTNQIFNDKAKPLNAIYDEWFKELASRASFLIWTQKMPVVRLL